MPDCAARPDAAAGADAAGADAAWVAAWAAALDELQLSLDATERLLRGEATEMAGTPQTPGASQPWNPPPVEGPIPPDLRTRALALYHRQQQVINATADAAAALRRQARVTSRLTSAPTHASPVYLDVTA